MFTYGSDIHAEKISYFLLRKPKGFFLIEDLYVGASFRRCV